MSTHKSPVISLKGRFLFSRSGGGGTPAFLISSPVRPVLPKCQGQVPSLHGEQGGPPAEPQLTPSVVIALSTSASGTFYVPLPSLTSSRMPSPIVPSSL